MYVSNTICLPENISLWIAQNRIMKTGEKIINKEQPHNMVSNTKTQQSGNYNHNNTAAAITTTTTTCPEQSEQPDQVLLIRKYI